MRTIISNLAKAVGEETGLATLSPTQRIQTAARIETVLNTEGLRYKTDYIKQNGRRPTFEEKQKHMLAVAEREIQAIQKRQAIEDEQQNIRNAADKGRLPENKDSATGKKQNLTKQQLQYIIDDYKKDPTNSMLRKIKANSNVLYRNMTDEAFILSIANLNNITLSTQAATSTISPAEKLAITNTIAR